METTALRDELGTIAKRAREILDAHPNDVPAEQKTALDALKAKAQELRGKLDEVQASEKRRQDWDTLDDYLNKPVHKVPHGERVGNGESETKTALKAMGWELKAGMWFAPTSMGTSVAMYPEEVFEGPVPTDKSGKEYVETTRAAFQPEYRVTFRKFISLAAKHQSEHGARMLLDGAEQKALSEGIDTAGGYLVPPDIQAEVLARLPMQSVMRGMCRIVTTSRDMVRFPAVAPNTNSTNSHIYTSGFVGTWAGETPAFSDTDPTWQVFQIPVRKLRVVTKLSNDLIADAVYNPLAFLSSDGAVNMGLVEDQGFITGDGAALQPMGILNAGLATVDVQGTTTDTISNTTSSLGSATKIKNVRANVPEQYTVGPNVGWLTHRLTQNKIEQLVDAQNRFIWAMGFAGRQNEIDGYPIKRSDFMPQDGTDGNKVLLFGDFSQYVIVQRAQITVRVLSERFADTDQTGIVMWERCGGHLWNTDAFRVGIV